MKTIKFLTYFYDWKDPIKRTGSPAGISVINYISKKLVEIGFEVQIISPSWIIDENKKGYISKETSQISDHIYTIKTPSLGGNTKLKKFIKKVISRIWTIGYLLKNIKNNEILFMYHEPTLMLPIKILQFFKKIKIIMITEELYSDIPKFNYLKKTKEINYLQKVSSSYIFSTIFLNQQINNSVKPYLVLNGTYLIEPEQNCKFNDGKIHCVYAGTFNQTKGGAFVTLSAAEFLDENYHVHIIGFGSDGEKSELLAKLELIKNRTKCTITYDGLKTGDEYIRFLQSCDIGFSTQNPEAGYNETSFPSKVLSYMANGLRVISTKIKVLECSALNNYMYYYEGNNPEDIARAIKNINFNDKYDSRKIVTELDEEFVNDLKKLLDN